MLTRLLRQLYNFSPEPVAKRLEARTPSFIDKFTVDFPEGKSGIIHGLGEANVIRDLFWRNFEASNPEFNRVLFSLAKSADTIVDIGSYLGYYTLTAAKANPKARIYSVEPFPVSVAYQKEMIHLNNLDNVTICDVALSDLDGVLPFYIPDFSQSRIPNIGSLVDRFGEGTHYDDRSSIRTEVDAHTLSSLFDRFQIESVDLIKFYIEEMETSVFTAAKDILAKHKPDLLGWIFYRDDNVEMLGELLDQIGYSHFVFKGQELIPCPVLSDAKVLGGVFNPKRGGRSSIFSTTNPSGKIPELAVQIPGLTARPN
jgi:FkbM family methyltransferase